jgi:hypothetical protein
MSYLLSVTSVGLLFLFGLGGLIGLVLYREGINSLVQEFPLFLILGLIINYGIVIAIQSLEISLIVGGVLSILGLGLIVIIILRSYNSEFRISRITIYKFLGVVFISSLYIVPILCKPLSEWDARSIWFFHAKMIYAESAFNQAVGWQDPSTTFSHVDYPNLVPVLAAQIAYIRGFWNEYIPKASLIFLLIPAIIWIFSFARRSFSFALLIVLLPFSLRQYAWNGYMDGYFALYFAISILLMGKYFLTYHPLDMVSSACCLSFLVYLKNEGSLAILAGLLSMAFTILLLNKEHNVILKKASISFWRTGFVYVVGLIPFAIWTLYKRLWGLTNYLHIGTPESFSRILDRLTDGSYRLIFQESYKQIQGALLLLAFVFLVSIIHHKLSLRDSLSALIMGIIYYFSLVVVYLLTPLDLKWQLQTSIERTMLPVNFCIFVAIYFIMSALEQYRQFYIAERKI